MKKSNIIEWASVVLALSALVISYNLLQKHLTGSFAIGLFDMGCAASEEKGAADCAAVLDSPWSYWPPRVGENKDKGGVPVALLGLVYYSVLSVWLIGVGKPSRPKRWLHTLPLLLVGFGLAGSAYFMWIMFTKLDQWCSWCLVTHVLNLFLAIFLLILWPRKHKIVARDNHANLPIQNQRHPSARQVTITILAMCLAVFGEKQLVEKSNWQKQAQFYDRYVKEMMNDGLRMYRNWKKTPVTAIRVTDDHPVREHHNNPKILVPVVMFSDFECPACRRIATFMEKQVQPLFAGNLAIVFKHYPLDQSCNERIKKPFHRHACEGALLAEAARRVGGNDGFWSAHDMLYKNQKTLKAGKMTVDMLAGATGLDAAAMQTAFASKEAQAFISQDMIDAVAADVTGTPTIFVTGRRVDRVAVSAIKFWDSLAEHYWKQIGKQRPASTKLKKAATQDNPGQPVAP